MIFKKYPDRNCTHDFAEPILSGFCDYSDHLKKSLGVKFLFLTSEAAHVHNSLPQRPSRNNAGKRVLVFDSLFK